MKKFLLLLCFLVFSVAARADESYFNFCQVGNTPAKVSGIHSTNVFQGSYPKCNVRVVLHGTTTLATLFSDNGVTPLANPFTANADGSYNFYAADGNYDITMSGGLNGGFPTPFTIPNIFLNSGGGGGAQPVIEVNGSVVPPSTYNFISGTNTTVSNPSGGNIRIDSTGGGSGTCGHDFIPCLNTPNTWLTGIQTFQSSATDNIPMVIQGSGGGTVTPTFGQGTALWNHFPFNGCSIPLTGVQPGATLIVIAFETLNGMAIPATDDKGDSYTVAGFDPVTGTTVNVATNVVGGTTTAELEGVGELGNCFMLEYHGIAASNPIDGIVFANTTTPSLTFSGLTTTNPTDILVSGISTGQSSGVVAPTSYTNNGAFTSTSGGAQWAAALSVNSSGTYNATWTSLGTSSSWGFLMGLKAGGSLYQSADLEQFQAWTGGVISSVNSFGEFVLPSFTGGASNIPGTPALAYNSTSNCPEFFNVGTSGWTSLCGGGGGGGVSSINSTAGAFTFNFSGGAGSCSGTTCNFTGAGTAPVFQTNSINNTSQTGLNFINPSSFNGLSFAFSNPGTNQETFGLTGTLNNAGLTNSSVTLGSTSVSLGGTITNVAGFNTTGTSGGLTGSPAITVASVTDSGLTSGNCVQASTGGLLTTTGSACGTTSGGVTSINTATGAFTFSFSAGAGSCSGTTCTFTGSSSGGGSVTNFIASSASWPTWLVPTVTLGTTTPTLAVAASTIPVAAGGTGTTTPHLTAGTNVTITGTWPNQTINSTGSGSGSVTSVGTTSPISGGPITSTGNISCPTCVTASPPPGAGIAHFPGGSQAVTSSLVSLTGDVTGILPVANGGSGSSAPSLNAGSNVTITGTWPNQTIASAGLGGSGTSSHYPIFTGSGSSTTLGNGHLDETTNPGAITSTLPVTVADGTGVGGTLTANEGTTPTTLGTAKDVLWADSATHRFRISNNNGTAATVATLSDLATSSAFGVSKCDGTTITCAGGVFTAVGGGGGGSVSSFSSGSLSPLFTTTVATPTSTPALSFVLTNAPPLSVFGNFTGVAGAPSYNVSGGGTTNFLRADGTWAAPSLTAGVNTVANSDSTLTISPTSGNVVASLNLAHANTFTAAQSAPTFSTTGSTNGALNLLSTGTGSTAPGTSTFQLTTPNALTAYALQVPAAQPTAGNTFLSCTAANPSVCTWTSASSGGVANTTFTVGTGAISANSCSTVTTITMTGLTTSMVPVVSPTTDISSVTGWSPASTGQLYFTMWPSAANTVSYKVCNPTSSSITPGSSTTWNIAAK